MKTAFKTHSKINGARASGQITLGDGELLAAAIDFIHDQGKGYAFFKSLKPVSTTATTDSGSEPVITAV